jgi:2-polyprenyl-3-methyl-5-hydroxy-6-metoxy-1,4-benzoquinol methylase
MTSTTEQIAAGQAAYTKRTLPVYDIVVLGISNRFIWRCPSSEILRYYDECVSGNHLDVGVGTGYFLDHCQFPSQSPRVALMDLNANSLEFASHRISRYSPETYRQNILEPIATDIPKFESVGVNYLLHCLPGSIAEKAVLFDHLHPLMNPGATLFGSTILHNGVRKNRAAIRLMKFYNRKGIFSNSGDDLKSLEQSLHEHLDDISVRVVGCVALFSGRLQQARPRPEQ